MTAKIQNINIKYALKQDFSIDTRLQKEEFAWRRWLFYGNYSYLCREDSESDALARPQNGLTRCSTRIYQKE